MIQWIQIVDEFANGKELIPPNRMLSTVYVQYQLILWMQVVVPYGDDHDDDDDDDGDDDFDDDAEGNVVHLLYDDYWMNLIQDPVYFQQNKKLESFAYYDTQEPDLESF